MQVENKIKKVPTGIILRRWLNSVPYGDYNRVRAEMVSACMVPGYIFANWSNGVSRIPKLAQCAINKVAEKYNGTKVFEL